MTESKRFTIRYWAFSILDSVHDLTTMAGDEIKTEQTEKRRKKNWFGFETLMVRFGSSS